jgi:hypothetical protein
VVLPDKMLAEPWEVKLCCRLALEPATTSYEEYNDIPAAMRVQDRTDET